MDRGNSLLLLEPIGPGAYQRAMEKRGPGLHHFAIDVTDLDSFISSLVGTSWKLHPISTQTIKKTRTAWFSSPGFPALVEVQEREEIALRPLFVEKVSMRMNTDPSLLMKAMRLEEIIQPTNTSTTLSLLGKPIQLKDLTS